MANSKIDLARQVKGILPIANGGSGLTGYPISNKSSNYTILYTDSVILASGTITITLPTAVGHSGVAFTVKNVGTGIITVNTTSSQTIDGVTVVLLPTRYNSLTVVSDGANWEMI